MPRSISYIAWWRRNICVHHHWPGLFGLLNWKTADRRKLTYFEEEPFLRCYLHPFHNIQSLICLLMSVMQEPAGKIYTWLQTNMKKTRNIVYGCNLRVTDPNTTLLYKMALKKYSYCVPEDNFYTCAPVFLITIFSEPPLDNIFPRTLFLFIVFIRLYFRGSFPFDWKKYSFFLILFSPKGRSRKQPDKRSQLVYYGG